MYQKNINYLVFIVYLLFMSACQDDLSWDAEATQEAQEAAKLYEDILDCIEKKIPLKKFHRSINSQLKNYRNFEGHCSGKDMANLKQEYTCVLANCNNNKLQSAELEHCHQPTTKKCKALLGSKFSS